MWVVQKEEAVIRTNNGNRNKALILCTIFCVYVVNAQGACTRFCVKFNQQNSVNAENGLNSLNAKAQTYTLSRVRKGLMGGKIVMSLKTWGNFAMNIACREVYVDFTWRQVLHIIGGFMFWVDFFHFHAIFGNKLANNMLMIPLRIHYL